MNINLCLLKFHSFNYNKSLHNQWNKSKNSNIKNENDVKNIVFLDNLSKQLKHLEKFENIKQALSELKKSDSGSSNHKIDIPHIEQIHNVIRKCHPRLYENIEHRWLENDIKFIDLPFYQIRINKKQRIICLIFENEIFPMILDINHCFYSTKNTYDNNYGISYPWDFRNNVEEIKTKLLY